MRASVLASFLIISLFKSERIEEGKKGRGKGREGKGGVDLGV